MLGSLDHGWSFDVLVILVWLPYVDWARHDLSRELRVIEV